MDRAEAKDILNYDIRQYIRHCEDATDQDFEALDLAIEALGDAESATTTDCNYTCSDCKHQDKTYEQEPCHSCFNNDGAGYEPDTDCISRADTIKALCQECKVFPDDEVNCADCTEVAIVRGMPPVNQKQVTSKLNNPDDSLVTEDSEACKEQKSKLDCISRQAVEEMIKEEMPERGMWEIEGDKEKDTVCEVCFDLMQKLSELSPVTPTERTGEWIVYPLKDEGRVELECPECGYALIRAADRRPHFCENCGAKMKGGTENE